jgi:enoyl-CoA hydratase
MTAWTMTREGQVAVLTLDDGKANALALEQFDSLLVALEQIRKSDAGAVLLTGRAGFFSAGLNLKILPNLPDDELLHVINRFGEAVDALAMFPLPTVAAVTGHAIAGGAILALCCDVRILAAGPHKFGLNEVPGGIVLPSMAVELMRAAAPASELTRLTLFGQMVTPDEALKLGIAHAVVAPQETRATALQRAEQLSELAGDVYATTKLRVRGSAFEYARRSQGKEMAELSKALSAKG